MLSFFGIFFPCLFPSGSWAINILDLMIDCFVMKIASGLVPRRQPFKKYRCYSLDSPWPSLSSDPGHPCHRRLAAGQHPPAPVDVGLLLGQHPPAPVEVEGWAGCAETWLFTQKSCGQEGTVNLKMKAGSAHSVFLLILTTPQMSSGRDRVCRVSGTINEQNVQLFPSWLLCLKKNIYVHCWVRSQHHKEPGFVHLGTNMTCFQNLKKARGVTS